MKSWKRILFVAIGILVLNVFGISGCQGKTEDIWQPKEPTKEQIVLLEKIYNEFENLIYSADETVTINWTGPYKEKFDKLCGSNINIEINFKADYYQKPDETLKKGGDCEDFAILFVSAAKNIDVPARVTVGKIKIKEKVEIHAWTEIYYRGKWQTVDPTGRIEKIDPITGEVKKRIVPFDWFIKHPNDFHLVEIIYKFDDKNIEGISPIERLESKKPEMKEEVFLSLYDIFKKIKNREPSPDELKEIKEITDYLFELRWEIIKKRIPEDPRTIIQPDNPELKIWIEKIKAKG